MDFRLIPRKIKYAGMVELVDSVDLGSSVLDVQVRVLLPAPTMKSTPLGVLLFFKDIFTGVKRTVYLLSIYQDFPQCNSIFPDNHCRYESHDHRNLFAKQKLQLVWTLFLSLT